MAAWSYFLDWPYGLLVWVCICDGTNKWQSGGSDCFISRPLAIKLAVGGGLLWMAAGASVCAAAGLPSPMDAHISVWLLAGQLIVLFLRAPYRSKSVLCHEATSLLSCILRRAVALS